MNWSVCSYDPESHYHGISVKNEYPEADECEIAIKNIGWSLGNYCPLNCRHCYSLSARKRGMNLTKQIVDRVISQITKLGVKTVNLGGNEPYFTNGSDVKNSMLPYIIDSCRDNNIDVGITSSGITFNLLDRLSKDTISNINDVDISLDSPYEEEHNANRGARTYHLAIKALEFCCEHDIEHTIIVCAMNWNFTRDRIEALVELARKYNANIRMNTLKPILPSHMEMVLSPRQYFEGFSLLMSMCEPVDLTEPTLAAATCFSKSKRCPCGRTSFRIHSITPDGKIPVSPDVYLHDYKVGDLLNDDIMDLVRSPQFRIFRRRNAHPELIAGCKDCDILSICGGGCAASAYLHNVHTTGQRSLFVKSPYCPRDIDLDLEFPRNPEILDDVHLVHQDYLCTWIGKPIS
jgi:radical SAM protein with 4Fe4S-binding SPASM domain